jgi:hypothetical protein
LKSGGHQVCTIKHNGFVINRKRTTYSVNIVSLILAVTFNASDKHTSLLLKAGGPRACMIKHNEFVINGKRTYSVKIVSLILAGTFNVSDKHTSLLLKAGVLGLVP